MFVSRKRNWSSEQLNGGSWLYNDCSNPKGRFKLYAGCGSYCSGKTLSQFQFQWTVWNTFRGKVPNDYSQKLLISISVFSTLLDRRTLLIPVPFAIEYRFPGWNLKKIYRRKNPVKNHFFSRASNLVLDILNMINYKF